MIVFVILLVVVLVWLHTLSYNHHDPEYRQHIAEYMGQNRVKICECSKEHLDKVNLFRDDLCYGNNNLDNLI